MHHDNVKAHLLSRLLQPYDFSGMGLDRRLCSRQVEMRLTRPAFSWLKSQAYTYFGDLFGPDPNCFREKQRDRGGAERPSRSR